MAGIGKAGHGQARQVQARQGRWGEVMSVYDNLTVDEIKERMQL